PQVKRVLVPVKTEVLSLNSIPIIVKTQKFTNNTEKKIPTFNVSISESLSNSISSKWSTGGSFKVGQKFTYGVSFGVEGKGETSIEYTQNWGIEGTKTKTFTIGSTSGVSVPLEPGESVISVLKASRGVMKVRIHYQAYLVGCAAINFKKKYQGHHFWGVDIQSIMQSAGITNAINTTEDIELEYYSDSEIIVKDANNEVTLTSLKFSDLEANMASPVID
ncbi:follicular epithelium yolk protein subunit, partial [Serratia sp. OS31]|nr:follicular epithelium yolk protein subunit [Serratia sp. OS31]